MEGHQDIEKLATHIPGFDLIAAGGLPKGRTTLLAGSSGSAKTVFAAQFLAAGIRIDENGVFVTFEEPKEDIRSNVKGFGWDIKSWEKEGKWAFVDASPEPNQEATVVGEYDFGALLARVEYAVKKTGATRLSMDSVGAIFTRFSNQGVVRRELFRIVAALKEMGVTALLTVERIEEYGEISRIGVEEFVADNVIILRNALDEEKRRRTIEILKFRGAYHQKGEWPFTVSSGEGVVVLPLSAIELTQKSSDQRVFSGNEELDGMCGGGFFRDSVILVSGATGTGKTLLATKFLAGGASQGEKCLMLAFEESREQLIRNARGWSEDFVGMEEAGQLKIICSYPEIASLEEHLIEIKDAIEEFRPNRLAVDSLSALERVATVKGYREFIVGLTSFVKHREIAGLFTVTAPTLLGGTSITESHISTITDTIILLRYVEVYGDIRRGVVVLKMRGSKHEKEIRQFTIDAKGMHIGRPFRGISGILSGNPVQAGADEIERLNELFKTE
ncbi:MAG TPA: circadian clock protein KaiC [Thermodesulfovibrionales bacterium]|nr:circadian clock protein KaiC [Thermodesulfovibrionales bacterium]